MSRRKVPQAIQELKTDHLKCRTFRHAWDPLYTAVERVGRMKAYVTPLECLRCEARCTETLYLTTGERHRSQVIYPEQYLVEGLAGWGGRLVLNQNVRMELYGRLAQQRASKPASVAARLKAVS